MADYIRDEEEQAERLKEWWQKNGTATIVVIVLAIGSMIGWRQWQEHSSGQAAEASKVYESLVAGLGQGGDAEQVRSAADTLLEDFESTAYADYARLALAKLAADEGNLNGAAEQLKAVAEDPGTPGAGADRTGGSGRRGTADFAHLPGSLGSPGAGVERGHRRRPGKMGRGPRRLHRRAGGTG